MKYCECEKPCKFLLPNQDWDGQDGIPKEACAICKFPMKANHEES